MLKLYGHRFSSYTWKALIALYANETPFEFLDIDPSDANAATNLELVKMVHPAAKFPVLVDGETTIFEATAIIEFLAAHHPGTAPLLPGSPTAAVRVRMLDRVFDNYVMNTAQLVVNAYLADRENPDPAQVRAGKDGVLRTYRWLETHFDDLPLRPHVSLVTCAAAPSLFYADWCEPIPMDCPKLAAYRAELLALAAVARCVEDARPYRAYFPPGAPDRD